MHVHNSHTSGDIEVIADGQTRILGLVLTLPPPVTHEALMEATGFAKGTVARHLILLREKGLIAHEPGKVGTIRPLVGVAIPAQRFVRQRPRRR